MRAEAVERALMRLARGGAVLAVYGDGGGYGVFPHGDRRRRPTARIAGADVRALLSEGALEERGGDGFVLSAAGAARARREAARTAESYLAQHAAIEDRDLVSHDGAMRRARALAPSTVIRRLSALRDNRGQPWLSAAEIAAAGHLRAHWEAGQAGLLRGSDLTAAPMGAVARGPSNAAERMLAARCDARRQTAEALDALAQPLRRVVESVCLREEGLEMLERAEGWPARSGKLALKMGLAQLAQGMLSR